MTSKQFGIFVRSVAFLQNFGSIPSSKSDPSSHTRIVQRNMADISLEFQPNTNSNVCKHNRSNNAIYGSLLGGVLDKPSKLIPGIISSFDKKSLKIKEDVKAKQRKDVFSPATSMQEFPELRFPITSNKRKEEAHNDIIMITKDTSPEKMRKVLPKDDRMIPSFGSPDIDFVNYNAKKHADSLDLSLDEYYKNKKISPDLTSLLKEFFDIDTYEHSYYISVGLHDLKYCSITSKPTSISGLNTNSNNNDTSITTTNNKTNTKILTPSQPGCLLHEKSRYNDDPIQIIPGYTKIPRHFVQREKGNSNSFVFKSDYYKKSIPKRIISKNHDVREKIDASVATKMVNSFKTKTETNTEKRSKLLRPSQLMPRFRFSTKSSITKTNESPMVGGPQVHNDQNNNSDSLDLDLINLFEKKQLGLNVEFSSLSSLRKFCTRYPCNNSQHRKVCSIKSKPTSANCRFNVQFNSLSSMKRFYKINPNENSHGLKDCGMKGKPKSIAGLNTNRNNNDTSITKTSYKTNKEILTPSQPGYLLHDKSRYEDPIKRNRTYFTNKPRNVVHKDQGESNSVVYKSDYYTNPEEVLRPSVPRPDFFRKSSITKSNDSAVMQEMNLLKTNTGTSYDTQTEGLRPSQSRFGFSIKSRNPNSDKSSIAGGSYLHNNQNNNADYLDIHVDQFIEKKHFSFSVQFSSLRPIEEFLKIDSYESSKHLKYCSIKSKPTLTAILNTNRNNNDTTITTTSDNTKTKILMPSHPGFLLHDKSRYNDDPIENSPAYYYKIPRHIVHKDQGRPNSFVYKSDYYRKNISKESISKNYDVRERINAYEAKKKTNLFKTKTETSYKTQDKVLRPSQPRFAYFMKSSNSKTNKSSIIGGSHAHNDQNNNADNFDLQGDRFIEKKDSSFNVQFSSLNLMKKFFKINQFENSQDLKDYSEPTSIAELNTNRNNNDKISTRKSYKTNKKILMPSQPGYSLYSKSRYNDDPIQITPTYIKMPRYTVHKDETKSKSLGFKSDYFKKANPKLNISKHFDVREKVNSRLVNQWKTSNKSKPETSYDTNPDEILRPSVPRAAFYRKSSTTKSDQSAMAVKPYIATGKATNIKVLRPSWGSGYSFSSKSSNNKTNDSRMIRGSHVHTDENNNSDSLDLELNKLFEMKQLNLNVEFRSLSSLKKFFKTDPCRDIHDLDYCGINNEQKAIDELNTNKNNIDTYMTRLSYNNNKQILTPSQPGYVYTGKSRYNNANSPIQNKPTYTKTSRQAIHKEEVKFRSHVVKYDNNKKAIPKRSISTSFDVREMVNTFLMTKFENLNNSETDTHYDTHAEETLQKSEPRPAFSRNSSITNTKESPNDVTSNIVTSDDENEKIPRPCFSGYALASKTSIIKTDNVIVKPRSRLMQWFRYITGRKENTRSYVSSSMVLKTLEPKKSKRRNFDIPQRKRAKTSDHSKFVSERNPITSED